MRIELEHVKYLEHCLGHVSVCSAPVCILSVSLLLLEILEHSEVVVINVGKLNYIIINFRTKHKCRQSDIPESALKSTAPCL